MRELAELDLLLDRPEQGAAGPLAVVTGSRPTRGRSPPPAVPAAGAAPPGRAAG
jgi:hypothetical protein